MFRSGILTALAVLFFASCATVPITGRKQMNLLSEATLMQMSLSDYQTFMKDHPLSPNQDARRMVQAAGGRLAAAVSKLMITKGLSSEAGNYQWEFSLVRDTTPNAWCMPGGKVVVYDGLLPVTKDESGLAVVIGHEVAHALARHGNERMSQGLVQQLGGLALEKAVETQPEQTRQIFRLAYGLGSQIGVMLPYSRLHENEADRIGLILMAMAKYNPETAVAFWERMSTLKKGPAMPAWLSTHPLDEERIANLKKNLPEAKQYYEEALAGR